MARRFTAATPMASSVCGPSKSKATHENFYVPVPTAKKKMEKKEVSYFCNGPSFFFGSQQTNQILKITSFITQNHASKNAERRAARASARARDSSLSSSARLSSNGGGEVESSSSSTTCLTGGFCCLGGGIGGRELSSVANSGGGFGPIADGDDDAYSPP